MSLRRILRSLVEVLVYSSSDAAAEEVNHKKKKKWWWSSARQGPDSLKSVTRSTAERRERRPCWSSVAVINCAEQGDFKG